MTTRCLTYDNIEDEDVLLRTLLVGGMWWHDSISAAVQKLTGGIAFVRTTHNRVRLEQLIVVHG